MYTLTLNLHGVVVKMLADSREQEKWLKARHRLFLVPEDLGPSAGVPLTEIGLLLARHGLFSLHAAAFRNKGGLGILAVGESGSGKSTVAFSALSSGYPYVCDDVALCRQDEHGILLLPFTNQIGIKLELDNTVYYDVLEHHPKDVFCQMSPDVVVFPHITHRRVSTLEKVTDEKTIHHTLVENIFWGTDKSLRQEQAYLLGQLSRLPAYTLLLGKDHKQNPQVAIDLLNEVKHDDACY